MLLPKKLGPLTLMRRLGSDGVSEAFVGILDEPAGQQVVAHRLLPWLAKDATRRAAVESRVQDLTAVRHPILVPVLRMQQTHDEHLVLEEWVDAVDMAEVIAWCRAEGHHVPHNVFLNLATQICNGLEALHGRPGKASGAESVLHMALSPGAVRITPEGRLLVGGFGLIRSPSNLPADATSEASMERIAYLAPEQTQPDPSLSPASDIFTLGSLLYEMLTLEPLFKKDSTLQTLHAVRRAEVSGALQHIKKELPGLDKVLYRALSLNPRHRYQRAFVLREDIRGLMAGYSFTRITDETILFLKPLFDQRREQGRLVPTEDSHDTTGALLRQASVGAAADDTMGFLRAQASGGKPASLDDDLPGLEMWSEVPTSVDPTDPSARPTATPPGAASTSPTAEQHTTWIPTGDRPPPDAFTDEESTDIARPEVPAEVTNPTFNDEILNQRRQATPAEAAALGLRRRPSPLPATTRDVQALPDPTSTGLPANERRPEAPQAARVMDGTGVGPQPSYAPPAASTPANRTPVEVSVSHDEVTAEVEDWKPKRGRGAIALGVGFGVFILLLACGGGAIVLGQAMWNNRPVVAAGTPAAPPTVPPTAPNATPSAPVVTPPTAPPVDSTPEPVIARVDPPRAPVTDPVVAPSRPITPAVTPLPRPPVTPVAVRPEPRPEPQVVTPPRQVVSRPTPTSTPTPVPRLRSDDAGLLADTESQAVITAVGASSLDAYEERAQIGKLSAADRMQLQLIDESNLAYTRSRVLLYEDARAREDGKAQRSHLETILARPENRYNPTYLAEGARLDIEDRNYQRALDRANLAERYWGRLPSALVFSRKAMIFEAQAAAWQGLFNASGGQDPSALQRAIDHWEKYQRHVNTKSRTDLQQNADQQLVKLYDARRRQE